MSRIKAAVAIALLFAVAGIAQPAHAAAAKATIKLMVAGSSALWQSMALAAYNDGACPSGAVKPCFHYTSKNFNLNDTRISGTSIVDTNTIWIVWDSKTSTAGQTPQVWAYIKVDSAVGDRCYFAHPHCNVTSPTTFPTFSNQISTTLWGDGSSDQQPGAGNNGSNVIAAFDVTAGPLVNAAASDIRPEDAQWATCRVNSSLSSSAPLLGLGYNTNFAAGVCAPSGVTPKSDYDGIDIKAALSANVAHSVSFNIFGNDPISGQAIPVFTTVPVGGEPVIFVASTGGGGSLNTVTNVTDSQVQTVFSGANCDASALGASSSDPLNVYLREALSGTMNTIEYTAFAYPDFSGVSQETGVGDPSIAANNPLNKGCTAGGIRERGVGTGDIINQLSADAKTNHVDSIGYAFFSYGNVSAISDLATTRYFTLNGVDPIWHVYPDGGGSTHVSDPGEANAFVGELPSAADLPAAGCAGGAHAFPCGENVIWSGGGSVGTSNYGVSFPNVRSGKYRAWSILRIVSDGSALSTAKTLVTASQKYATSVVPDFIPAVAVLAAPGNTPPIVGDPGLSLLRSHYLEKDTAGTVIGNPAQVITNDGGTLQDVGGDEGGCILHMTPGTSTTDVAESDSTTQLTQNASTSNGCSVYTAH
jgi:hypothetical protein